MIETPDAQPRALRILLWLSIVTTCVGFGAKAFDLIVLCSAWGASPPESLKLMPYGKSYPLDPGDFFIPISLLLVTCYFGAFITGWKTPYRMMLAVPVVLVVVGGVATPTIFWPMIRELYGAGQGTIERTPEQLTALVRRWVILDILRTVPIIVGFVCHFFVLTRAAEPMRTKS